MLEAGGYLGGRPARPDLFNDHGSEVCGVGTGHRPPFGGSRHSHRTGPRKGGTDRLDHSPGTPSPLRDPPGCGTGCGCGTHRNSDLRRPDDPRRAQPRSGRFRAGNAIPGLTRGTGRRQPARLFMASPCRFLSFYSGRQRIRLQGIRRVSRPSTTSRPNWRPKPLPFTRARS